MIDKLGESVHFFKESLNIRAVRHAVLSSNIANAETPGYKARDVDFNAELKRAVESARGSVGGDLKMASTSPMHYSDDRLGRDPDITEQRLLYRVPDQVKPDGNSVDMEVERTRFLDNSIRYQSTLQVLSSRFQSLKNAMNIQ